MSLFFFFFFNDPATTEIYTLSLHDALPICIQVAQIAGIPKDVVTRAMEILSNLEGTETDEAGRPRLAHNSVSEEGRGDMVQLDLFGSMDWTLREWITGLDIDSMTPVEALVELNKLKESVASK